MAVLIPKNSPIPAKKEGKFYNSFDNQTNVSFRVYQGERSKSTENYLLGKLKLSGIPSAPRGEVEMNVCFEIDANGNLNVLAREITIGLNKAIKTTDNKGEIEEMTEDANRYKVMDEEPIKKAEAHNDLGRYASKLRSKIADYKVWLMLIKMGLSV